MFEKFVHEDHVCRQGNTVYHSAFLRKMHLILLAYSQTNSCIWLTKEAILGQAATVATENTWSRAIKTVSSCFSSLAQINRVNHVFDRSTLTTIINKLVSCFVVLLSGPMQRTLTFSSSKRSRTLQSGLSVFPENLTMLLRFWKNYIGYLLNLSYTSVTPCLLLSMTGSAPTYPS